MPGLALGVLVPGVLVLGVLDLIEDTEVGEEDPRGHCQEGSVGDDSCDCLRL